MTFSKIGRLVTALVATAALGLGMTACGGGTVGYLWVLGTYYNQISGFQIDNYTGNLTAIPHTPFASGGTNPVSIVVKPGGRFVYVINSGTQATGTPGTPGYSPGTQGNIAEFAVGGGGTLTYQQAFFSQGSFPVWATLDGNGNYLYVLDKFAPDYNAAAGILNGSITAFAIAGDTGRLTLVPNTSILTGGIPSKVFEVGPNPVMTKVGSGGCLYTLSPNSIYPYAINGGNGQLTTTTTGPFQIGGSQRLTSINTGGTYTYLTDGPANQIYALTAGGSACSLAPVSGSQSANLPGTSNPVNSITSTNGSFLYVLNQSSPSTVQANANSSISAFHIDALGRLEALAGTGSSNPYASGSGPVCIVADPTNQYLYISNSQDSTVTGKQVYQNQGFLSDLNRGSVFRTSMNPSCLAVSGNL